MRYISEITEFSKSKNKVLFEDNSFLVIYKGMYGKEEREMSDEDYIKLRSEMLGYGKKRAMNLLVRKDYSRKAMEKKLADDGYNSEIIEEVFSFLDSYHYLDDARVAEHLVKINRNSKSMQEIRFILKRQELPDDVIDNALSEYYRDSENGSKDDADGEMAVIVYHLKKLGMTPEKIKELDFKERQKLAAKLFRKGFKAENISKAMRLEDFE